MKILHSDLPKFNQFAEYVVESTPEIIEKNIVIGAEKCRVPLSNFVDGSSESLETVLKAYQESDELKAVELDDTETEALKEKYHEDVITYATQKKSAVDVLEKLKEIAGYPDW